MDYLLGIDVGTSGAKAAVVDTDGRVLGLGRREYGIATPQPGWAEQDPDLWVDAASATVHDAMAQAAGRRAGITGGAIKGIGLSGQMHTTVLLGAGGKPLRPAILWADQRSAAQVAEVYRRLGPGWLGRHAQNPLAAGFTLATLLWLQENEPDLYGRIAHVLLPKDYVRYRLTGEIGTEPGDASATLLMDVAARGWSREILDACNIPAAALPAIARSAQVAGWLKPEPAARLGLPAGIPVVYGSGDQSCQAVGNGVIAAGTLSCTIGTGGQILAPSLTPAYDTNLRLHTFCHALPGLWFVMAATLSAGLSLNWLRGQVLGGGDYGALADAAAEVEPGAGGLFFLPYLAGERTPHMDPAARGAFVGLTLRHGRPHLVRAVMEGVVFSLRQGLELIEGLGVPAKEVIASGGGTRHPLWLQLQADIFNRPIRQTETQEAAAFGAALIAGAGVGVYQDVAGACAQAVRMTEGVVRPDPRRAKAYNRLYERYVELYPRLAGHFRRNLDGD